jgi:hypothetical protein
MYAPIVEPTLMRPKVMPLWQNYYLPIWLGICLLPQLLLIPILHHPWTFYWVTMEAYWIFMVTWVMCDNLLSRKL